MITAHARRESPRLESPVLTEHYAHAPSMNDVRLMLRLASALHQAPANPIVRHELMLDELCEWTGASLAVSVLLARRDGDSSPASTVLTMIYAARWPTQSRLVARAADDEANALLRDGSVVERILRRDASPLARSGLNVMLHTSRPLISVAPSTVRAFDMDGSTRSVVSALLLFNGQHTRPFDARSRRMLSLVHSHADWMYHAPSVSPPPAASSVPTRFRAPLYFSLPRRAIARDVEAGLSTRQRQTLRQLLSGESEKQIAMHMSISRHTVHEHVKAVYRAVGVSSRPELMARFLFRARARSDGLRMSSP